MLQELAADPLVNAEKTGVSVSGAISLTRCNTVSLAWEIFNRKRGYMMKRSHQWLVWLGLGFAPILGQAQLNYDMGKSVYQDNCATCHGATGKGDGPLKAYLVKPPSDLTTITQRNHGTFPHQRVWEVIDGRSSADPGPHGSREMPIWGNEFKTQPERAPWWGMPYGGMHRGGSEWQVNQRISALVDYLSRIQVR